jgi:hypothetical protein
LDHGFDFGVGSMGGAIVIASAVLGGVELAA